MKIDKAISDAAKAAGVRFLIATDVHLGLIDRRGIKRRFFKSSFGWIEADSTAWGWRATVRQGTGPLFERAVSGMARGRTLDEAAVGGVEIFPSAVAAIRAAARAGDAKKSSRLAGWLGLPSARAA